MSKLPTKMPENWGWEVHNVHTHEKKRKQFAEGKITLAELQEFEFQYRESEDQRAERWKREHYLQELEKDNANNYRQFKENGKAFAKKYLQGCDSKYKYTKKLYELFKMRYKQKAKLRYIECYNLLKLRTDV